MKTIKQNIYNFFGKNLDRKFIVFESDDWGSERIPSKDCLTYLNSAGFQDICDNPFNFLDSLETEDDLNALFDVLIKFRDRYGNHPVITANSVTCNPDFDKIRASNYNEYFYQSLPTSWLNKPDCYNNYTLFREGISQGIFYPQFHGREHLNVQQWMSALNSDDLVRKAFNIGIYAIDFKNNLSKRSNFTAAFDLLPDPFNLLFQKKVLIDGLNMFQNIFKYKAESFIAPCYVWHPYIEKDLVDLGIKSIQGIPYQYVPSKKTYFGKIFHYQGERNKFGQLFFVRNCFFEPSLNPGFDWVKDCISRIRRIFNWGKPAIIGTHRINFIGSIDESNRRNNLTLFSNLIKSILKEWPDVEFITTNKLGEFYNKVN